MTIKDMENAKKNEVKNKQDLKRYKSLKNNVELMIKALNDAIKLNKDSDVIADVIQLKKYKEFKNMLTKEYRK